MTIDRALTLHLAFALLACSGCSAQSATPDKPAKPTAPAASAPAAATPTAAKVATGTVVETLDTSTYTYVRVKVGNGEIWAATTRFNVAVGDRVTVPLDMPVSNFHSDTLKRDFPLVYFAARIEREGAQGAPALPPSHPPVQGAAPAHGTATTTEPVAPAAGGLTVAQVWARRASLAGTTVTVRGRVVKYNPGILGRNWLHLQDGSGSSAEGTHDLTVTTTATAQLGAIVTASGAVAVDKDFGAGYTYKVMVENATLEAR